MESEENLISGLKLICNTTDYFYPLVINAVMLDGNYAQ